MTELIYIANSQAYGYLKDCLKPWAKDNKFSNLKRGHGWRKQLDSCYLIVKAKIDKEHDVYSGNSFEMIVEVTDDDPNSKRPSQVLHASSLALLLTKEELEKLREQQNQVIAKSLLPFESSHSYGRAPEMTEYKQKQVDLPVDCDVSVFENIRFVDWDDIESLAKFLSGCLPRIMQWAEVLVREEDPEAEAKVKPDKVDYELWPEIVENPEDDVPRLVFADGLCDAGDPRGEFIHLQCRLKKMAWEDDERAALVAKESELLRRFKHIWISEFEDLKVSDFVFERGFIRGVEITANQLIKSPKKLFDRLPLVDHLRIKALSDEQVDAFCSIAQLDKIQRVQWCRTSLYDDASFHKVFNSEVWTEGIEFDFHTDGFGIEFENLVDTALAEKLKRLWLGRGWTRGGRLEDFLETSLSKRLEFLSLSKNSLRASDFGILARSKALSELKELDVSNNQLGNSALKEFATEANQLKDLEWLNLAGTSFNAKGSKLLVECPSLQKLNYICLEASSMRNDVAKALSERFHVIRV